MAEQKTYPVSVWEEIVTIPTYGIGEQNKNPMFLEKRVYQGSSGVVYPNPIIESVSEEKADKEYTALFLENRYIKIMLLPEIGGRVQMAYDKTNDYHFVYYNQVIKPALVGLTGPWISGGIEFNWPQHHRPSTFEPMSYTIEENEDGSKTVWMGEIERMFRTSGTAGFTLHPDRAYLEIKVKLHNRTSEPQTFLWWANPAVAVNDDYQSVFPPDVTAVMDHGKRDVSSFPIATGEYYKMDYSPGIDISRYKNIPVPTSYMAEHSDFDFLGCYDHGVEAGMLHVANHHQVPGKKQWTWGNDDFGQAWDRQLTDEDGPYIELMCGAYTDNQPDFTWLMPGEEKNFTQVFMPYKLIGAPKNASIDAAVNLEIDGSKVRFGAYVTSPRQARVMLTASDVVLFDETRSLSPETALVESVIISGAFKPTDLTITVSENDTELISFTPLPDDEAEMPQSATPAKRPEEIDSNEELFLNGLHLEQYRHATYEPEPYYEEAIRRDPLDSRANNALGLLLYRRGQFAKAEPFFRKAIKSLTRRNPNPYDGEPLYNLGMALAMQGRYEKAYDSFYKATWNSAWASASFFELARLAGAMGRLDEALDLIEESLGTNARNHRAHHLRATFLRRLGEMDRATEAITRSLDADPLNLGLRYEASMIDGNEECSPYFRENDQNYIEIALDYTRAGLFDEAESLLEAAPGYDPMVHYYLGWFAHLQGNDSAALRQFVKAAAMAPDFCFPNRIESVPALEAAISLNPDDARAPYYLGNFWYAHRQYDDAITCWEKSLELDPGFATVNRNLGLAYVNKRHDLDHARELYEAAFAADETDSRVLFELDQLYKKRGVAPEKRLAFLEKHLPLVEARDDLTIIRINLLNLLCRSSEALAILQSRTFHPWEGGEGKVTGAYVASLVKLAKSRIRAGKNEEALALLQDALTYPDNLGEGKLTTIHENDVFYYLGETHEAMGETAKARSFYELAAEGSSEPVSAMYYNDQPPEMIFYQGLAYDKLGDPDQAREIFGKLIEYGEAHRNDDVVMDYFAVSLPDFLVFDEDLNFRNRIHCEFMLGLGCLGLGENEAAAAHFDTALTLAPDHLGAAIHKMMID